jgi:hypothetical protein
VAQVIIPDRDPRIDPQRGDMVRGNGEVRRVMAREGDRVRCASGMYDYRMRLDNWQKWCRLNDATAVVEAARTGETRATLTARRTAITNKVSRSLGRYLIENRRQWNPWTTPLRTSNQ